MRNDDFLATIEFHGDVPILAVAGDLDIYSAPKLDEAMCEARSNEPFSLIVSLERCGYCDSTGLSVLLRHAHATPIFVVVAPFGTNMRRFLNIAGVEEFFGVVDDLNQGLRLTHAEVGV